MSNRANYTLAEPSRNTCQNLAATLFDLYSRVDSARESKGVTTRELLRKAKSGRNSQSFMEARLLWSLSFGSKPRETAALEQAKPEQLTTPSTPTDRSDQNTPTQLEMKSDLEARHRSDLRRDITTRLLPSESPCVPGDKTFYWQVCKSNIKQGAPSGQWFRAQVVSKERAICVFGTGSTVKRANQTKMRRE